MELTRLLYLRNDVEMMALLTPILSENFEEVVFWYEELYMSTYVLLCKQYIYITYMLFVRTNDYDLSLYNFIDKQLNNESITWNNIYKCLYIIYYSNKNSDVFTVLKTAENTKFKMYRGKIPNKYNDVNSKFQRLVQCLDKKNLSTVYYYVKKYVQEDCIQDMYDSLNTYFGINLVLPNVSTDLHILLHVSNVLTYINNHTSQKPIHIDDINEIEDKVIDIYCFKDTRNFKVLNQYRKFPIILDFKKNLPTYVLNYTRPNNELLRKMFTYDWIYFASYCPLWKIRIDGFSGTIDHDKKNVIFDDSIEKWTYDNQTNLTDFECFHNIFDYEFDEQSINTQHTSLGINNDYNFENTMNANCVLVN
jgi:hypothetical protein